MKCQSISVQSIVFRFVCFKVYSGLYKIFLVTTLFKYFLSYMQVVLVTCLCYNLRGLRHLLRDLITGLGFSMEKRVILELIMFIEEHTE